MSEQMDEVEQCWREFWLPIVAKDGAVDIEQVKKELFDFKQLMRNASIVYDHVTRSRITNVLTLPDAVMLDEVARLREENTDPNDQISDLQEEIVFAEMDKIYDED